MLIFFTNFQKFNSYIFSRLLLLQQRQKFTFINYLSQNYIKHYSINMKPKVYLTRPNIAEIGYKLLEKEFVYFKL